MTGEEPIYLLPEFQCCEQKQAAFANILANATVSRDSRSLSRICRQSPKGLPSRACVRAVGSWRKALHTGTEAGKLMTAQTADE